MPSDEYIRDIENNRIFHSYGYDEGYKDGYNRGFEDGRLCGYAQGYADATEAINNLEVKNEQQGT